MDAYRKGERWWPSGEFEREHIQPEQEARFECDEWENVIRDWVLVSGDATQTKEGQKGPPMSGVAPRIRCTVVEVATMALGIHTERMGTREQRRISAALQRLGWGVKRTNGQRVWTKAPTQ